jgi:glutamate--cysteine ligase
VTELSRSRVQALRDGIDAVSFRPQAVDARRIGAEVEFLVVDEATDRPLALRGGARGLIERVRRHASRERAGWTEAAGYGDVPRFEIPGGATITFEPGGQLEVSSAPAVGASALIAALRDVVQPLRAALEAQGVRLDAIGIDPHNDAEDVPLQLNVERYERMTAYLDSIGPFGIRMMRQTAAIQLSVDRGSAPAARWRLLNDLAPYLIAIFANSPHYLDAETGHRSFRAHCWRALDPSRTGVAADDDDPAAAYTRFALGANDILGLPGAHGHAAFAESLKTNDDERAWQAHLTTLFPEVRPRGHFEVRSCDAIGLEWLAVPIVLLAGLVYDAHSAREAAFLAADSRSLLRTAGADGLDDTAIARTARDLFQLGLEGAQRLGNTYVSAADLDRARQFYARYTSQSRSPGHDRQLRSRRNATLTGGRTR